jgi:hypothetical protein
MACGCGQAASNVATGGPVPPVGVDLAVRRRPWGGLKCSCKGVASVVMMSELENWLGWSNWVTIAWGYIKMLKQLLEKLTIPI